ncbi:uncharacterized protein LOC131947811 [Physella acuta]|uniref:uncharacterized protein LOC131947811 n=1 Tax=Physella acuta TaxID=109671 RepID=UPI0027DBED05|nr:uncharacterized protein LOC131947811 [Physella acuta]XP_059165128.1 uncharacterized protein LOC131947811 [Physella acuta]XP_059165129.1 uncharacterized protein LOC131947811 [Physella acuta]
MDLLVNQDSLDMDDLSFMGDLDSDMTLSRHKRFITTKSLVEQSRLTALYIIFILFILLLNGFFIIVILESKTMRASSRHILILSVCIGDMIMSVFVLPVLLEMRMRHGETIVDCPTFFAMRIFADFLIPSVTTLAMLALNIDYILRLCCSAYSEGCSRTTIIVLLFLMPWVVSGAVLIPLYIDGMNKLSQNWLQTCDIEMGGYLTRTLLIVSYFPQAGLLLVFNLAVSILYLCRRESYSLDVCGERIRAPVDICLASFTTMLFYTPIFLVTLLTTEGYLGCEYREECHALRVLSTVSLWLMFTKSWVVPLCWFACRDTRACIRHLLACC